MPTKVSLLLCSIVLMTILNCGEDAGSLSPLDNNEMLYRGAEVIEEEDLPSCDSVQKGWLYYVLDDANFQYCDGDEYVVLNIMGDSGTCAFKWLGNHESSPEDPLLNEAYHNTLKEVAFIWDGEEWDTLVTNGRAGADGVDGKSIVWQGSLSSTPEDPDANWAYFNNTEGISYIYNGTDWDTLSISGSDGNDGTDGAPGTNGVDGKSVIWQGASEVAPESPESNWAYYNSIEQITYMFNGTAWDTLIIKGADGIDGVNGTDGTDGVDGKSVIWQGASDAAPESPESNWAYYNSTEQITYIFNGSAWDTLVVKGEKTLLRLSVEPAGSNCAAGGQRVETGLDLNKNGVLENNEVSDISYICQKERIWYGNVTITDSASRNQISGYTLITGNLKIKAVFGLENLDFLNWLSSVGGDVSVTNNSVLTNIDGLSALALVGGDVSVTSNSALTNTDGLSALTSVGKDFYVDSNSVLTNVNGLSSLASVGENFYVGYNRALTNVNGLSSLASVGGYLEFKFNTVLTNVNGLSSLASVGGYLKLEHDSALTNVDGLSSLTSVGGELAVLRNGALTNVNGLSSLASVGGDLAVYQNVALTNVDGLSSLTAVVGKLGIGGNVALMNVDGLSSVASVGGELAIEGNSALMNVDGLSSLTLVNVKLTVADNGALTNVDGLSSVVSVMGPMSVYNNSSLINVDGLNSLVNVEYDFALNNNISLADMTGLSTLERVIGDFTVTGNDVLPDCQAQNIMSNLIVLVGTAKINGNDAVATCP